MQTFMRQGDILITRMNYMPSIGEEVKHDGSLVIAEGEFTGHSHKLIALKSEDMEVKKIGKTFYVHCKVDIPLRHEEHKEIIIPKGFWTFGYEVERDPYMDSISKVQD